MATIAVASRRRPLNGGSHVSRLRVFEAFRRSDFDDSTIHHPLRYHQGVFGLNVECRIVVADGMTDADYLERQKEGSRQKDGQVT